MTREEAIELKAAVGRLMYSDNKDIRDYNALIDFIESALRPVSREQVEKVCGGCEKCNGAGEYSRYAENLTKTLLAKYCPHCGRPLTDEAVEMVMRRLEALKDGSTTD